MKKIRASAWDEVLCKMVEWANHPESNERRYIPDGPVSESEFLRLKEYTFRDLPTDQLDWTLAEIQKDDIPQITYMFCIEWSSIKILDLITSPKIKAIQSEPRQEVGVLLRGSSMHVWNIILDGCHRISAAHLEGNLVGQKVFLGEGNVQNWTRRWLIATRESDDN